MGRSGEARYTLTFREEVDLLGVGRFVASFAREGSSFYEEGVFKEDQIRG